MGFGDLIDRVIEPFAPSVAARRMAARTAITLARNYDAAKPNRSNRGRRAAQSDANAANQQGLARLRGHGWDVVRNNKYARAGVRSMVAHMIGDGIAPQFVHEDPAIRQMAQDEWDRWADSKVDGHDDFYGFQRTSARGCIVAGESLTLWKNDADGPDGLIEGLESDYLDQSKSGDLGNGRQIIQGVQFNANNLREGYWLFDRHPGSASLTTMQTSQSALIRAGHVDHLYDRERFGQVRGTSWLAATINTLFDIDDIEDAARMQQKIQACLGLILTPGEGSAASPLAGAGVTTDQAVAAATGILEETVRPGMIFRAQMGDQVNTINPSQTGGAADLIRQQLAAVSASMVPYHVMTGDVSQANYSSLRAAFLAFWTTLDDVQQHVFIPHMVKPAVQRRMRRLFLETGDRRFLSIGCNFALPVRRFVDPVKDLMAEIMEIRAGLKLLATSLAERGINADVHLQEIKRLNDTIDLLGLALDSDPRRLTDSGVLQAAAGYIAPKAQNN